MSNFFSNVIRKNNRFALTKPHFLNFELVPAVKNDALQMPPKEETCKKTQVFQHFMFNMLKQSWRQLQGGESADSLVFHFFNGYFFDVPVQTNRMIIPTNSAAEEQHELVAASLVRWPSAGKSLLNRACHGKITYKVVPPRWLSWFITSIALVYRWYTYS